jgi:hypothetical protein
MKTKTAICILLFLVATVVVWLFRTECRSSEQGRMTDNKGLSPLIKGGQNETSMPLFAENHVPLLRNEISSKIATSSLKMDHTLNLDIDVRGLLFAPVDVYGKVADQNGNPVPNAVIRFTVSRSIHESANYIKGMISADSAGLFHICGYEGVSVSFRPEAPGYVLAESNPSAIIKGAEQPKSNYVSDPTKPIIIKMWRMKGPESLICVTKQIKVFPTNGPIHLDLLRGIMVPTGGDISIDVNRPLGPIGLRNKANWSMKISVQEGGLIPVDDEALQGCFEAPDSTYDSEYLVIRDASDRKWSLQFDGHFFIRSRGGKVFSKFSMSFILNEDAKTPCWLGIQSVSNANGSRNLEEDPAQMRYIH